MRAPATALALTVLLTGCTSSPEPEPSSTEAQETETVALEAAQETFLAAHEEYTETYDEGIRNGDNQLGVNPEQSLEGFSQQRAALYDLDKALRDERWPENVTGDMNQYLAATGTLIGTLDQINQVSTTTELDTLYEGELQEHRELHQSALEAVLDELQLEPEEAEEPTRIGGGGAQDTPERTPLGDGGEIIEDAGAVVDELQGAIKLGTPPHIEGSTAFPEEWIPYTQRWKFAGSATTPDIETISGNTIVTSKRTGTAYMGAVVTDILGYCYAIFVEYGPEGDASRTARSGIVRGECTHQGAVEEFGY